MFDNEYVVKTVPRCYTKLVSSNLITFVGNAQKVVCFYDSDGNLIEVGTPM